MKDSVLLHVDESTKGIIQELENSFSAISSVDLSGLSNLVGNNKTSLDIIKQDVKEIKGKINSVSEQMDELSESDIESELQAISRNVAELIDSKSSLSTEVGNISGTISSVEQKTNAVNEQLGKLATSVNDNISESRQSSKDIAGKIDSLLEGEGSIPSLVRKDVSGLNVEMAGVKAGMEAISKENGDIASDLKTAGNSCQETLDIVRSQSERIAGIEAAGNNLQQISGSIKEEQDSQKQQIEMLTQRIQNIETELAKVQEKILSNQLKLESELSLILDMVTPFWKKKKTNK